MQPIQQLFAGRSALLRSLHCPVCNGHAYEAQPVADSPGAFEVRCKRGHEWAVTAPAVKGA